MGDNDSSREEGAARPEGLGALDPDEQVELWQSAVDALDDAIHVVDRDLRLLLVNRRLRSWAREMGVGQELIGRPVFEVLPIIPSVRREAYERLFEDGTARRFEDVPPVGRREVVIEVRLVPIHRGGRVERVVTIIRDLTAQRRLREHLQHAQKMEAIGQLAGGIAHDFNNLLTAVLGHASLLRTTLEPGTDAFDCAETIEQAAERAGELTSQLLGFARKGKFREVSVDLHETIEAVGRVLERTLDKSISLSLRLEADQTTVRGDPGQLKQVLMNLCLNARDAMADGGILVIATGMKALGEEQAHAELGLPPGRYLAVTVRDTGRGISPDTMDRIFEPFFTTKKAGEGLGMGLAMVYGIVENHGGKVTADSVLGRGTSFELLLPLADDLLAVSELGGQRSADRRPRRVMVVDDEVVVLKTVQRLLEAAGYEVVTFLDGEEAVDYHAQHSREVDLVIIDMVMPRMDGRQCYLELRGNDPSVKALLSSGYAIDERARQILALGVEGFLQKPYHPRALIDAVEGVLRRR